MQDLTPSEIEAILKGIGNTMVESTVPTPAGQPNVSRVQFSQLQETATTPSPMNYAQEHLMDLDIQVDVILGRTRVPLRKLLSLQAGNVLALDKFAGEPVDIEANGKLIARGEIVGVDDHFGVRIIQLNNV
jgi:flagellar motor switch protein FliN/FliY